MSFGSRSVRRHTPEGDQWVFVYEWFAGWRWERYRGDDLQDEALESYQTVEECVAHAGAHGYRPPHARRTRPRASGASRRIAARPISDAAGVQPAVSSGA